MVKDHSSTVVAISWHPTAPVIATASTDYKCRIVSAYLKNLDGKGVDTPWGAAPKFGTVLFEWESYGWVQNVAFAPEGDVLALCAQNSTVSFVDVAAVAAGSTDVQTLRLSHLPLTQLLFLPDGSLVGAGHAYNPVLFVRRHGAWAEAGTLKPVQGEAVEAKGVGANFKMFQAMDKTGRSEAATVLDTVHQFCVCDLRRFSGTINGHAAEFTSSARDGKIVWWSRDELVAAMKGLDIRS